MFLHSSRWNVAPSVLLVLFPAFVGVKWIRSVTVSRDHVRLQRRFLSGPSCLRNDGHRMSKESLVQHENGFVCGLYFKWVWNVKCASCCLASHCTDDNEEQKVPGSVIGLKPPTVLHGKVIWCIFCMFRKYSSNSHQIFISWCLNRVEVHYIIQTFLFFIYLWRSSHQRSCYFVGDTS